MSPISLEAGQEAYIHCQQPVLSQAAAQLADVLGLHIEQIGDILIGHSIRQPSEELAKICISHEHRQPRSFDVELQETDYRR